MQYVIKATKPGAVFPDATSAWLDRQMGFAEELLVSFRAIDEKYQVTNSLVWDQGSYTLTIAKVFPEGATMQDAENYTFELGLLSPVDHVNGWDRISSNIE